MAEDFITYATNNGVTQEAAEALASSCLTLGDLNNIVIGHYAYERSNVGGIMQADIDSMIKEGAIHKPMGVDIIADPIYKPEFWDRPARINGQTLTWEQAYNTILKDMPVERKAERINDEVVLSWKTEPLDLGKAMRTVHSDGMEAVTQSNLPKEYTLLISHGQSALLAQAPGCDIPMSALGDLPLQTDPAHTQPSAGPRQKG